MATRHTDPWVGPWLAELRKIPRQSMAARLGRNLSAVARFEAGVHVIAADDLPLFLSAYGVTINDYAAQARRVARSR